MAIAAPLRVWWAEGSLAGAAPPAAWRRLTRGSFSEERIAGDHFTCLRPPRVSELARDLDAWLA